MSKEKVLGGACNPSTQETEAGVIFGYVVSSRLACTPDSKEEEEEGEVVSLVTTICKELPT